MGDYLVRLFGTLAETPHLDGVHLDYIRYPDVILPVALWKQYNLVQNEELPQFDFCYCAVCRAAFKQQNGVDPLELPAPSADPAWRQYRYDSVTRLVQRLVDVAHQKRIQITAAVFPTPGIARKLVRQDWTHWNLDAVLPMTYQSFYNEKVAWIEQAVREGVTALPPQPSVVCRTLLARVEDRSRFRRGGALRPGRGCQRGFVVRRTAHDQGSRADHRTVSVGQADQRVRLAPMRKTTNMKTCFRWFILAMMGPTVLSQDTTWKFPCPTNEIAHYTAQRVTGEIRIDGVLDEPVWQVVTHSPRFVDIITGQPALHDTRAMVVWDDRNLYVAYRVSEPNVQAKYTQHDDPIYYDNDVEFFLAGPDAYYEFELNAYNTSYEVFFIWADAYESGGFAAAPEFARSRLKPFDGVGFTHHPRGGRFGQFEWTFPGKRTAVHVEGTVNDRRDTDRGWTAELAFPWAGCRWLATDGRAVPPRNGDVWRMDFSRFNAYKAPPPAKDSGSWVWTRHGVWDSHIPECFVFVEFSTNSVSPRHVGP